MAGSGQFPLLPVRDLDGLREFIRQLRKGVGRGATGQEQFELIVRLASVEGAVALDELPEASQREFGTYRGDEKDPVQGPDAIRQRPDLLRGERARAGRFAPLDRAELESDAEGRRDLFRPLEGGDVALEDSTDAPHRETGPEGGGAGGEPLLGEAPLQDRNEVGIGTHRTNRTRHGADRA